MYFVLPLYHADMLAHRCVFGVLAEIFLGFVRVVARNRVSVFVSGARLNFFCRSCCYYFLGLRGL